MEVQVQPFQFFCQNPRCRRPLDLDDSLFEIDLNVLKKEGLKEIEDRLKDYEYELSIIDGIETSNASSSNSGSTSTSVYPIELKRESSFASVPTAESILPQQRIQPSGSASSVSLTAPSGAGGSSSAGGIAATPTLMTPTSTPTPLLPTSTTTPTPTPSTASPSMALPGSKLVNLFSVASEVSGGIVDHPLCKECTHKQLKNLETQVAEAMKENTLYVQFLEQLTDHTTYEQLTADLQQKIAKVEEEEQSLRKELSQIEHNRQLLRVEMDHLSDEANKISQLEQRYWLSFNSFQDELQGFVEESSSVKMKLINSKLHLEKLKITNIYNDTFHIWHDGHFGTINNFRMGRLPSQPVDWNEINAAWGQATLLLFTIANKLGFKFSTYRLLPMGSNSKIEKISDKSVYELFGSSDISLGRLFWYRRFDNGMQSFLQCLKEIADFAESKDKNFKLPYRIEKDKIGDMSIKIQFNNEETWTRSLKYMLTNLKFLLVWVSRSM